MNFEKLLHDREALLRSARLANLAFAYARLGEVSARLRRAGLPGALTLELPDDESERFWPTLVAHSAAPSLIEEHFLDEEILELADVLAFLREEGEPVSDTFSLATIDERWRPHLRERLQRAGVSGVNETAAPHRDDPWRESDSSGRAALGGRDVG